MISESIDEIRERLLSKAFENQEFAQEYASSKNDVKNVFFPEVNNEAKRFLPDPILPLSLALLFEDQIMLDLFPFETEQDFVNRYGLLPSQLRTLVDEGALRINILDSPIPVPGSNKTVLDHFEASNVDYTPLVNAELIESEKLYSVEQFSLCNPEWTEKMKERRRVARKKDFTGNKLLDQIFLDQMEEEVDKMEESAGITKSTTMQSSSARKQGIQNELEMAFALGYEDLVENQLYWQELQGISVLTRLEQRDFRFPFSTIQTGAGTESYQNLVNKRGTNDLPQMDTFPTDLTQTLMEFGGWNDWTNQSKFGGLHFRMMDISQDSPSKYFEEYMELRKQMQNSSAIGLYEDCHNLFKKKDAEKAAKRRINDGTKASEELDEILQSYETVSKWSGKALKVTGATIAANGIGELAVPLAKWTGKQATSLSEVFRQMGGEVGEEVPEEIREEILKRASETGLTSAIEEEIEAGETSTLSGISELSTNFTAQEAVEHLWRNYLWRPAKRGELEILSASKLREYENKSQLRDRVFPFIIGSELRKSDMN